MEFEVSIGEAIDKLTILDIKRNKIANETKRAEVLKEYNSLSSRLESFLPKIPYLYSILLHTNQYIWDLLDEVKTKSMTAQEKLATYEIIWDENDRRFRIKNKINNVLNSNLKEQKGYAERKAFVLAHLGMGDMLYCVGMVRYLSTLYDKTVVVCKRKNLANVQQMYSDDPSIEVYPVDNDSDISVAHGCPQERFKEITDGYTVYALGCHAFSRLLPDSAYIKQIPKCFYENAKVPWHTFWTYFYVNSPQQIPVPDVPYAFVHSTSSGGPVFSLSDVNIDPSQMLIVDPCKNHYSPDHHWYSVAESYVNKPLLEYIDVITNATRVVVADSSFMCLAWHLPLRDEAPRICARSYSYAHLWSSELVFPSSLSRRVFYHI